MNEIFSLTKPLWEIALRATIVYVAIVVLVRIAPKRNAGAISPNDMLTLIIVGGMGTDAIMGGSTSVGDILILVVIIFLWAILLDKVEYSFPGLRRFLRETETSLIEDGRFNRRNMRREMVTEQELMAVLRKQGVDDPSQVKSACLEADGEISVVPLDRR